MELEGLELVQMRGKGSIVSKLPQRQATISPHKPNAGERAENFINSGGGMSPAGTGVLRGVYDGLNAVNAWATKTGTDLKIIKGGPRGLNGSGLSPMESADLNVQAFIEFGGIMMGGVMIPQCLGQFRLINMFCFV